MTSFLLLQLYPAISTLNDKPLKLVDYFIYLSSNISSSESDFNLRIGKAWTAIDSLSTEWKSDHSDKMKWEFFVAVAVSVLLYCCTTWTIAKHWEKKLDGNYTRILGTVLNRLTLASLHSNYIYIYIRSNKTEFPPRVNTTVWMHHMEANKTHGEKAR